MRNESDEYQAREERKRDREEDPASKGMSDPRLGKPPSEGELALIPRA